MNISLIIVHWNTPELLEKQLNLLGKYPDFEVIVVDNASQKSLTKLKNKYPDTRWIENPFNRGFSFACNQGAQVATGEWLLFLNPDVFITPNQILGLLSETETRGWQASSPFPSSAHYRKPVPSLVSLVTEFSFLHRFIPLGIFFPKTLIGGCLFIKKTSFEKIGKWDERFFLWFEDSDLTRRLVKMKIPFGFCKNEPVEHLGGASFDTLENTQHRELFFLSLLTYSRKHFSPLSQAILRPIMNRFAKNTLLPMDTTITSSIVVPNMKADILKTFLEKNISTFNFTRHELIIVTSDAKALSLKREYPEVIFIFLNKNLGFSHTVNTGFLRARGQYLGTVNDDTILPLHWIEQLEEGFSDQYGSCMPVVLKPDGSIESAGVEVLAKGKAVPVQVIESETFTTSTLNAACVLFRREALAEVGLFDEKFGSYLEDIDLGLRLARRGWQNKVVSKVKITHLGQQTSQSLSWRKQWLDVKNWWRVMLKNYPISHWLRYWPEILLERARNLAGLLKSL